MAFFRGDLDGNGAHDELANQIAQNGKVWVEEMWHWSDMQAYFYRLLLEVRSYFLSIDELIRN